MTAYISGLCYKVTSIKRLVVCDRFSKMSYFITMTEKITAEGLAKLIRDNV